VETLIAAKKRKMNGVKELQEFEEFKERLWRTRIA